jgi:DNA primase
VTTQQAKNIPLSILLEKMGFQATRSKHNGNDVWYKSPFRPDEGDANFHINVRENVWYDFGSAIGGDVVKFIEQFNNCDVSDALVFLDALFPENLKSDKLHEGGKKRFEQAETLTLKRAHPITNPHLITYLKEDRKIDLKTAQKHLIEVIYTHVQTGRDFYALGMANRSGGFEIRNKYFKGSIFEKDITILTAKSASETDKNPENKVSIFEGFFDFLSALKFYGDTLLEGEVIIMHSVAFQNATIAYLTARAFSKIYTYFDNDRAGEELTYAIGKHFPKVFEPCSALFYPHKDFNEFWVSKK